MDNNENIEFKRILDILKSKKVLILVPIILIFFTLLGYLYSYYYVVPKYQSVSTLLLIPNDTQEEKVITSTDLTLNSELIYTYSNIAKQSRVLKQVINNLNLNMTEQELGNKIKVNVLTDTYIIEITVTDANAQNAMNIAQEVSNVFLSEIKEIYHLNNIGIVDVAQMPIEPYNIHHKKDIGIFIMAGFGVSGMIVMLIYILDNTIKEEDDIERYIKIKALGKIPVNSNQKNEIINKHNAKSYITECINTIRTNILYMSSSKGSKTILVTSCMPREGKSWVSANIAASFAETNKKVLLIDADMRKGRAYKIFNCDNENGLSNYLYSMTSNLKKDVKLAKEYIQETQIPNLHILTNGTIPPNPSELIDSENMKELIMLAKSVYDIVIIDAPPCKLVTDSIILSTIADYTILIANSEKTKINELKEVKKSIESVGGRIIGSILNKVKVSQKTYGKSYYYGHREEEEKCEVKEKQMVSVKELIEQALPKIDEKIKKNKKANADIENEKAKETFTEVNENNKLSQDIAILQNEEFFEKQNENLKKVMSSLSDIKVQLKNYNKEEKKANEITQISNELQEVKEKFKTMAEFIENVEQSKLTKEQLEDIIKGETLSKEAIQAILKDQVLSKEEMKNIVKDQALSKEEIENIVKSQALNKEEIENIVKSQALNKEEIENIVKSQALNKEEIENIVKSQALNKEEIENIVKEQVLKQEQIETIIREQIIKPEELKNMIREESIKQEQLVNRMQQEHLTKEEIEAIVKQEMSRLDYTEQFRRIQEATTMLQDNYLELLNMIKEKQQQEEKAEENKKVIDIKLFQKQSIKKRTVYPLQEDIPFEELEKTACYVLPIREGANDNFSTSEDGNMLAIR